MNRYEAASGHENLKFLSSWNNNLLQFRRRVSGNKYPLQLERFRPPLIFTKDMSRKCEVDMFA